MPRLSPFSSSTNTQKMIIVVLLLLFLWHIYIKDKDAKKFDVIVTKRKETGCEDSNTGSAQELNLFIEQLDFVVSTLLPTWHGCKDILPLEADKRQQICNWLFIFYPKIVDNEKVEPLNRDTDGEVDRAGLQTHTKLWKNIVRTQI